MLVGQSVSSARRLSAVGPAAGDNMLQSQMPRKYEPYVEGNLKIHQVIQNPGGSDTMTVRFTQDGSLIAIGQADGTIRMCSPDSGACLHALSEDDHANSRLAVTSLRFKAYEESDRKEHRHILMASYASGHVKFWHYTSGKCMHTINEGRQTLSATFNPQGTSFLTCGADPSLHLYDVATMKKIRTLEPSDSRDVMNGHRARVFAVQYHQRKPHMFVSGGWDDTIQFWDDRRQHAVRKLYGPHICGDSLDIDPVQNHLLTGSWRKDNVLQIWDFDHGELIKDVPQDPMHRSLLYSVQWLGRENIICGGCDHNMVRVLDRGTLNTVGQLIDLPSGVYSLDNDRQAKYKIAAAAASNVYVLKLEKHQ